MIRQRNFCTNAIRKIDIIITIKKPFSYFLKSYIETRAVEIANYIVENNATVRQAAKQFGISKSTVHKDITDADRLLRIDPELAAKARHILDINKSERHIRGGLATREKYLHLPHVHAG